MDKLEANLRVRFGTRVSRREPLACFTSFQIGGPADLMVTVESEEELAFVVAAACRFEIGYFCLGLGTNLLVSDRGIRGLVIRLGEGFRRIEVSGCHVLAGAGASFGHLVGRVVDLGLSGLEFGEGIPGTVGGGLVMNAGAFGGEMARVVTQVHGVTGQGQRQALSRNEVNFAYRRTDLPVGFIITRVEFELERGDRQSLRARVAELKNKRGSRQPRGLPNAGSIFRNPPGAFAGKLLESAGLKGERHGKAAFSDRHANFIVNLGGARAEDVHALIEIARRRVRESSGIWLEPEVRLVGDW
ncbi:MAG TPA: UDP-N-acetylmuramate dehydrogenase [Candidatus Binataceae bacterium]|jgi:UDP-N-acetylmuramate dehydrogenase